MGVGGEYLLALDHWGSMKMIGGESVQSESRCIVTIYVNNV